MVKYFKKSKIQVIKLGTHQDIRQILLFPTVDIREPIREDIGTGGTSSNIIHAG